MKDVLGRTLNECDHCFYIKHKSTSVGYALVEIREMFEDHCTVVCISSNPTRDITKGVGWNVGSEHKRVAYTNLMSVAHRRV